MCRKLLLKKVFQSATGRFNKSAAAEIALEPTTLVKNEAATRGVV